MVEKKVSYKDYNGVERSETFYFNLEQSELLDSMADFLPEDIAKGVDEFKDVESVVRAIIDAKTMKEVIAFLKAFIDKSYGVKSEDGRRFVKDDATLMAFKQTPAYSKIYMEMATNSDKMAGFINAVIPEAVAPAQQTVLASNT